MEFDGKEEALAREKAGTATGTVTPIRAGRGTRKQNKEAAKAEALGRGVKFEFDGKSFEVEPADQWDIDVFEFASDGDIIKAVRCLIGEEQYQEFKTDADGERIRRTLSDLNDFWEAATKAQGVEPGESSS